MDRRELAFKHLEIFDTEAQAFATIGKSHVVDRCAKHYQQGEGFAPMPERAHASTRPEDSEQGPASDYIEQTRAFWQPHAKRPLTREDARKMAHNLIGFFAVLREWTIAEKRRAACGITPEEEAPRAKRGRPRKNASKTDKKSIKC